MSERAFYGCYSVKYIRYQSETWGMYCSENAFNFFAGMEEHVVNEIPAFTLGEGADRFPTYPEPADGGNGNAVLIAAGCAIAIIAISAAVVILRRR